MLSATLRTRPAMHISGCSWTHFTYFQAATLANLLHALGHWNVKCALRHKALSPSCLDISNQKNSGTVISSQNRMFCHTFPSTWRMLTVAVYKANNN